MHIHRSTADIPRWIVGVMIALVVVSGAYGLVVMESLLAPAVFWLGVFSIVLAVFLLYLLYRLVVAVETLADRP